MTTVGKLTQVRKGHRLCADKLMAKSDKKAGYDEMKIMLASLVAREVALKKCDADILDNLDDNDAIMVQQTNVINHTGIIF